VAGLDAVDARSRTQNVVVDDVRGGTRVGRDAGVFERLGDREEIAGRLVAELVVAFADGRSVEVFDGGRERVDVGCLGAPTVRR
jgi:hypothetical protein